MKMKRIVSSALMGILLVTTGSIALAEEKDEKDLSAYQWGYWDKMVSPAAGPLAPVGVVVSAPLPPTPIPTPTLIPASDPDPIPDPIPIPDPVKQTPKPIETILPDRSSGTSGISSTGSQSGSLPDR